MDITHVKICCSIIKYVHHVEISRNIMVSSCVFIIDGYFHSVKVWNCLDTFANYRFCELINTIQNGKKCTSDTKCSFI